MYVFPSPTAGGAIDASGKYRCPLCVVQASDDVVDTGWVRCPMVDDKWICLGCCIDHQGAARSKSFATHPDLRLFEKIAKNRTCSIDVLREKCLQHQLVVAEELMLASDEDLEALRELKREVQARLAELTSPTS